MPAPQKTKASPRKTSPSFKNLPLAPPVAVERSAKSSYWLRGTKRPPPGSFAKDGTRVVAVFESLRQDVRLDRALFASADEERGYSRFFGTKLRRKRPLTGNKNGTDKKHSEVKDDGAMTPTSTPTPSPKPTPTPTPTPEFPDGMVEAAHQANQEQLMRGEPADDPSAEPDPIQRSSEEPFPGSVGWDTRVAQELHPKMKGLLGSSRKTKSKRGSTQQSVASVSVEAVVPQSSMMEVFSRASKRRASTQNKLPHHSGLPFTNPMLPLALNALQVACSVLPDEEAKQFVQRQASLSNAREAEGSSESRAAQLKDDTPVGTKRDWEGQAKHAAATSIPVVGKAPAKPRLGYSDPNRAGKHPPSSRPCLEQAASLAWRSG